MKSAILLVVLLLLACSAILYSSCSIAIIRSNQYYSFFIGRKMQWRERTGTKENWSLQEVTENGREEKKQKQR